MADLEGDTHGDFEDLLVALVTPPDVYDCQEVIRAIKVSCYLSDEGSLLFSRFWFSASGRWDEREHLDGNLCLAVQPSD